MKDNHSHITLVVDRSGSMASVRSDAEGAVNQFITDQQKVEGTATLTLVEFDAPGAWEREQAKVTPWYHIVHKGDLAKAPQYRLNPRGNTALLDAVGVAIVETGSFLTSISEDERPAQVFFVVQTDGQENSSKDWTLEALREVIKVQTDDFTWNFIFLGMGVDTFAQGHSLGFTHVTQSGDTGAAYVGTYTVTGQSVSAMRRGEKGVKFAKEVDDQGNVKA